MRSHSKANFFFTSCEKGSKRARKSLKVCLREYIWDEYDGLKTPGTTHKFQLQLRTSSPSSGVLRHRIIPSYFPVLEGVSRARINLFLYLASSPLIESQFMKLRRAIKFSSFYCFLIGEDAQPKNTFLPSSTPRTDLIKHQTEERFGVSFPSRMALRKRGLKDVKLSRDLTRLLWRIIIDSLCLRFSSRNVPFMSHDTLFDPINLLPTNINLCAHY